MPTPGRDFPASMKAILRMRTLFVRVLWPTCFALLLPFTLLSSSLEADDTASRLSAIEIERLWNGVLGCADAGDDNEIVKNALAGGSEPGGARRDYLDCSTRALRAAASRMLLDTIEDSLRLSGLNLFDREFRLDSNLTWGIDGDFRGELDTILPIGGTQNNDGTGRALFFQQGITFWEGRNGELRSDSNIGVVYRGHVSRDWILGGSFFFDYNFQREHSRLSVGVDVQSGIFHGGLNYYFTPPGNREWRRGRTGYEERALEGLDLRWSFAWERIRVGGAFGAWIFDGELDGRDSGWRRSASISADYRVFPGVFFKTGYEYHDGRSVDENWNLGLAFQYSLPDMEGSGGSGIGGRVPDLWRIVDREKRILYEERLARARVSATLATMPADVEEGDDVTVRVVLGEALEEDVFFSVVSASSSTADADDYGPLPSRITIPTGALSAEATFRIANDSISEPDEILDLELKVLQESFFLVSRGNPHHARVVIGASDNSFVGFATESTSVAEGIDVEIPLKLGEPAPAGGFVLVTSSDNEKEVITDTEMRIVQGAYSGQYIRVTVVDDKVPENMEMVRIFLAEPEGGLPGEWRINRREHMLMIQPHGLNIAFEQSSSEVNEDAGTVNLILVLNGPAPAGLVLNASSSLREDVVPVHSTLTVPEGAQRVELPVRVIDDSIGEGDEVATIRISSAGLLPEGWSIGQGNHELTIKDFFVGFESSSSQVHESDLMTDLRIILSEVGAPAGGMSLSVSATGNDEDDISFLSLLPISGGDTMKDLKVMLVQDNLAEDDELIVLTLSGSLPSPWEFGERSHNLTILSNQTAMFSEVGQIVSEGVGSTSFKVKLSREAPAGGVPLQVAITSGNDDNDVTFTTQNFTIAEGEDEHTLTVDVNDDNQVEPIETVTFTLWKRGGFPEKWGGLGLQKTFVLTITDDDSATVGFTTTASTLTEGNTTATLTVSMSAEVSQQVEVTLTESGDENNDLAFTPTSLTFLPGETSKEVVLTVNAANDDSGVEEDVKITYTLEGMFPWNVSLAAADQGGEHVVTFVDDDSATVGFTTTASTLTEGDTTATLTVSMSAEVSQQVEVTLTESGDENNDLAFTPTSLTFLPGETSKEVVLTVNAANDDSGVEEDVKITYTLEGMFPWNVSLAAADQGGEHVVTFVDDDSATVGFTTTASTLTEGDTTATLTVSMSAEVSQQVEVTLTESGDGNNDLAFTPTSLTFLPGETSKEVVLTVNAANDNTDPEADFQVTYRLEGTLPEGVTFDPREHVVTFVDDDKTISFKDSSSSADEGTIGHPVAVVLNFDPPADGLEVAAAVDDDHKDDVSIPSPVLNFTGSTRELSVLLDVLQDVLQEGAEIAHIELMETATPLPVGWTLVASGDDDHDLTILPSDQTAMFAEAGRTVGEGDGNASFKVELSEAAPAGGVPLQVAVTSGNDDNDVTFTTQSFTIVEGQREHTISVVINDDNQTEEEKVVRFTLSKGASAVFPDAWGDLGTQTTFDLTIEDNDQSDVSGECPDGLYPDPDNKVNGPFRCTPIPSIPARCNVRFAYKGETLPENLDTWHKFHEIYDWEGRYHITQEGYDDRFDDFTVGYGDTNCPPLWVNVTRTSRDGVTPLNPYDLSCRCRDREFPEVSHGVADFKRIGGYPVIAYRYSLRLRVVNDGTKYTDPLKEEARERVRLNVIDRSGKVLASLTWFLNAN